MKFSALFRPNFCGGSLLALQTSQAEVPGSNPASPTMILMRCRIIVNNVEKSQGRQGNLPLRQKKDLKKYKKWPALFYMKFSAHFRPNFCNLYGFRIKIRTLIEVIF